MCSDSSSFEIYGPQGRISTRLTLPETGGKCPLVIHLHGFLSSKDEYPVSDLVQILCENGIGSLSFDFEAHGDSEGSFDGITIANEIADARAVFDYACTLPTVGEIAILGHSMGGLVASILAGELENSPRRPKCLVLLAPAASIVDDVIKGHYLNAFFDPANPPEFISVLGRHISRRFLLEAKDIPVYELSKKYTGPVCILQGNKDSIVPLAFAKKYQESYENCNLQILEGEGHNFNSDKTKLLHAALSFLKDNLR